MERTVLALVHVLSRVFLCKRVGDSLLDVNDEPSRQACLHTTPFGRDIAW